MRQFRPSTYVDLDTYSCLDAPNRQVTVQTVVRTTHLQKIRPSHSLTADFFQHSNERATESFHQLENVCFDRRHPKADVPGSGVWSSAPLTRLIDQDHDTYRQLGEQGYSGSLSILHYHVLAGKNVVPDTVLAVLAEQIEQYAGTCPV